MIVLVQLKNDQYVMGNLAITNENSIEIDNAMLLHYMWRDETVPSVFFTKYCLFNKSTCVELPNEEIRHIFKDPLNDIVSYYKESVSNILKYKPNTNKKHERKNRELLTAMMEKTMLNDEEVH